MRKPSVLALLLTLVAVLASCNRYPDPTVEPENLPPVPELQLSRLTDEARQTVQTAHERALQYPGDARANGELGMALHANRRYEEAIVMYDRARKLHPHIFHWEYYRAVALSEMNDVAEAGASFRRALELQENEPNALLGLAQLYFKSAELADNQALEAEGEKTLDLLIETHPDYVLGHLVKAGRLEEAGNVEDAIQTYRRILDSGPAFGMAHQALSRLYEQRGNAQNAERHAALARQSASQLPPNQNRWAVELSQFGIGNLDAAARGQMLLQNRLMRPAAQAFESAVESDPENVHYRVNLVALYGMAKNLDRAQEHYNAALRIGGADAKVHLNMGTILLGEKKLDEAEAAYNRALAADGATVKAHLGLARIALHRRQPAKAESFVRQALNLEPFNPLVHSELLRVLRMQGKLDEAVAVAEQGVIYSEGRTQIDLLRKLADIHDERGDATAARGALGRARAEAERSESNVDLALIDAQIAEFEQIEATP